MYINKEELGNKVIEDSMSWVCNGHTCSSIQMVSDVTWVADAEFSEYNMSVNAIKDVLSYINNEMVSKGYELYLIPYTEGDIKSSVNAGVRSDLVKYKIKFNANEVYDNCMLYDSEDFDGLDYVYCYIK